MALVGTTQSAHAVPPPDFIFSVGSQIVQIFSIAVLFLTAVIASARQYARVYFDTIKHKKLFWSAVALVVTASSLGGAYIYSQSQQEKEYQKWFAETQINNTSLSPENYSLDKLKETPVSSPDVESNVQATIQPPAAVEITTPKENSYILFIKEYYGNIGTGKIKEAYEMSKKSVSLETYAGWYKAITSVAVNDIQSIDDTKYSLLLTLQEGKIETKYAVLMTIAEDASGKLSVANSQVRVLPKATTAVTPITSPATNTSAPLMITNDQLKSALSQNKNAYILDAREDEEYEIGQFPGSVHIRFADLVAGRWIDVPGDKTIYVFCWSGMRGKDVATFLRTKNIQARYVENGANGWFAAGGTWQGGIKFTSKYGNDQYLRVFSTSEVKSKQKDGIVLVDSREPQKFLKSHISGSVNIPMIYTPTSKIPSVLAQVPQGKNVITICDDFISCFDAKVAGIKLEKRGNIFLGRYAKPWEY